MPFMSFIPFTAFISVGLADSLLFSRGASVFGVSTSQATVPFGERGLAEALYVSGATLTTVGYGDVVAGTDALRILSVLESGGGLAAITAAVTYLLSVHSAVSELRASAVAASQLRLHRPADAIQVVRDGAMAADTVWVPANSFGRGVLADLASPGTGVTVTGGSL